MFIFSDQMNFRKLNFIRAFTIKRRINRLRKFVKKYTDLNVSKVLSPENSGKRAENLEEIEIKRKKLYLNELDIFDTVLHALALSSSYLSLLSNTYYDADSFPRRLLAKYLLYRAKKHLRKARETLMNNMIEFQHYTLKFSSLYDLRLGELERKELLAAEMELRLNPKRLELFYKNRDKIKDLATESQPDELLPIFSKILAKRYDLEFGVRFAQSGLKGSLETGDKTMIAVGHLMLAEMLIKLSEQGGYELDTGYNKFYVHVFASKARDHALFFDRYFSEENQETESGQELVKRRDKVIDKSYKLEESFV